MVTEGELFLYAKRLFRTSMFLLVMAAVSITGFFLTGSLFSPPAVALVINSAVWTIWFLDIRQLRQKTLDKLAEKTMERVRMERPNEHRRIAIHDDDCGVQLVHKNGGWWCPRCSFGPDMQSIAFQDMTTEDSTA